MKAAAATQPRVNDTLVVRALVVLSVLIWMASLGFPGYYLLHDTEGVSSGLEVLVEGAVFGPLCWGIAVYANLPYAGLAVMLFSGRDAFGWLVAMLALMLALVMFNSIPTSWGPGPVQRVDAWGVGAVLWVAALVLAGIAGVVRGARESGAQRSWYVMLGTLAVVVLGAVSLMLHPVRWPQPLAFNLSNGPAPAASQPTVSPAASAP